MEVKVEVKKEVKVDDRNVLSILTSTFTTTLTPNNIVINFE